MTFTLTPGSPIARGGQCALAFARTAVARPGSTARVFRSASTCFYLAHVVLGILLLNGPSLRAAQTSFPAEIISMWGRVEVSRAPGIWDTASTNGMSALLRAEDEVRTLLASGAEIQIASAAGQSFRRQVRLGPFSRLKIPAGAEPMGLSEGIFHFFSRSSAHFWSWATEKVYGSVHGTDFIVEIGPDGALLIRVAEGSVFATNRLNPANVLHLGDQEAGEYDPASGLLRLLPYIDLRIQGLSQTFLYYPGVIHLSELEMSPPVAQALAASLAAYAAGDLGGALDYYPRDHHPGVNADKLYLAGLLLLANSARKAQSLLDDLSPSEPGFPKHARIREALRQLLAAGRVEEYRRTQRPELATEWLAESYYQQSRAGANEQLRDWETTAYAGSTTALERALDAARLATPEGSIFGYAWARRAELEFGFGRIGDAESHLRISEHLQSSNAQAAALRGFLAWARQDQGAALAAFHRAARLDSRLGNAWLGIGLTELHQDTFFQNLRDGHWTDTWRPRPGSDALRTLEIAAAVEPHRSHLRSYLGKAYYDQSGLGWGPSLLRSNAYHQLDLASRLDPNDPTPYLYLGLIEQQENRINESITNLETSLRLNENRRPFRSSFLLDQDSAVRSANLAGIYQDAGLDLSALQEAGAAVTYDFANYSAHLFLANAYNALRDPRLVNLRFETPTFREYLLANLLSPVGGTALSPQVSQAEYTRMFQRNRVGLTLDSSYQSNGDWSVAAANYGVLDDFSYALDGSARELHGTATNTDLEQRSLSVQLKQQLGFRDTLYFQTTYDRTTAGDVQAYYDPNQANPRVRVRDEQAPNVLTGFHREWSPGMHSILLLGYLSDDFALNNPRASVQALLMGGEPNAATNTLARALSALDVPGGDQFDVASSSRFQAVSSEFQQIYQDSRQSLVTGVRAQVGWTEVDEVLASTGPLAARLYLPDPSSRELTSDFSHVNTYGYYERELLPHLRGTVGLSADWLQYPANMDLPPFDQSEARRNQVSPKVGFRWNPLRSLTLRAAYSRSLGGFLQETSVGVEPTQVAGFNQAYRTLVPVSPWGATPGATFDVIGAGADLRLLDGLYAGITFDQLASDASRPIGVFGGRLDEGVLLPSQITTSVNYDENALMFYLTRLVGREWSFGLSYRWSEASLVTRTPLVPQEVWNDINRDVRARLHDLNLFGLFNHSSGLFARFDAHWMRQDTTGYVPARPVEDFCQLNALAGYRFLRRRAEIAVGLLNLTDQDYRLDPLSIYSDLPRERTGIVRFRFNID